MSPQNVPQAEAFCHRHLLEIVMGSRYLGGVLGTKAAQAWLIEDNVEGWISSVDIMAGAACQNSHTAYAELPNFLHKE